MLGSDRSLRRTRNLATEFLRSLAVVGAILVGFGATPATARGQSDSLRVLFIGNSYTYFNNLPRLVQGLAESDAGSRPIAVRMIAPGGMTLKGHLAGNDALKAIGSRRWDFVVLQEQSALANPVMHGNEPEPGSPNVFFAAARSLDSAARARGAKTVFYETWARVGQPQHTATIADAYEQIAKELGSGVAPVGRAFAIARTERPTLVLNIEDKSHPTSTGSFLAACVLYQTLTGRAPHASGRIVGTAVSHDGVAALADTTALVALSHADARYLQDVAQRAVQALSEAK
ncbi:MAG: hypothetical protein ABIT38_07645 [Gemmatimonadaceae bacterium]